MVGVLPSSVELRLKKALEKAVKPFAINSLEGETQKATATGGPFLIGD